MNIRLHQKASPTLAVHPELQAQPATVSNRTLAEAYGLNRHTTSKWCRRDETAAALHRPHQRHAALSAA